MKMSGVYLMLYFASLYILGFRNRTTSLRNKRLVMANTSLFVLGTAQAITFWLFPILVTVPSVSGMTAREANIENILFMMNTVFMTSASFIADSLLIWRCYIIWGRRRRVIAIPVFLLVCGTLAGVIDCCVWGRSIYVVMTRTHISEIPFLAVFTTDINVIFFSMSLATNIVITSLISMKIWWDTRDSRRLLGEDHGRGLRRAMLIIIESGSVYSLGLLLSVIFNTITLDTALPQNLLAAIMSQIVGIFPTAITVLVGLGATAERTVTPGGVHMPSLGRISFVQPGGRPGDLESQTTESEDFHEGRISVSVANAYSSEEAKVNTKE
ncbi:hypothetical protein OE88DRAFT_1283223 [Heliocybe sulcata]|uniref:G-protein coupled receptors family 1 profile domain-containing protein n=1 Tax=Heliocybe sulcata TaxID=5364 RepID=A0A5C3N8Z3_9AGAM|nr:hypothetical protein OE88DRAFT_1283223 [Heliocybe sulcata]